MRTSHSAVLFKRRTDSTKKRGSNLLDFIFSPTDWSWSHTDSNFPSWRSLSSVCLVIWVSVLEILHVSSHWYFSAQHAASVSMLLSVCSWLTACLCEPSKRCRVSLNKLMGSFIFGAPLFRLPFFSSSSSSAISENTVVWCLLYTVGRGFQEHNFNTEHRSRWVHRLRSNLKINSCTRVLHS